MYASHIIKYFSESQSLAQSSVSISSVSDCSSLLGLNLSQEEVDIDHVFELEYDLVDAVVVICFQYCCSFVLN